MTTAVRVNFTMRSMSVISPVAKHFDALLSKAAVTQAEFNGHNDPWSVQHDIGIAKHEVNGDWCFKAGEMKFEWIGERGQLHYIKRSDIESYADAYMDGLLDRRPAFDGTKGSTKAGSYLQPFRWAKTVHAYCVVEDMKRFEILLPWVTHIGKLQHKGCGAVLDFEVVLDPNAEQEWVKRNLPKGSEFAKDHALAVGGLRSPYWLREKHQEVLAYTGF